MMDTTIFCGILWHAWFEEYGVRAVMRRGKMAGRRAIPSWGIACLALLAFAGACALAPEMGALGEDAALSLPAFTWLNERAAQLGARSDHRGAWLGPRAAQPAARAWTAAPTSASAPAPLSHAGSPAPHARGALALPALLIAVALAQIRA